jgi:hypothetical protein
MTHFDVRNAATSCLKLRDERTSRGHRNLVAIDPTETFKRKNATTTQAGQRVARYSQSARAAKTHDYSMRRSVLLNPPKIGWEIRIDSACSRQTINLDEITERNYLA